MDASNSQRLHRSIPLLAQLQALSILDGVISGVRPLLGAGQLCGQGFGLCFQGTDHRPALSLFGFGLAALLDGGLDHCLCLFRCLAVAADCCAGDGMGGALLAQLR
ncbi:hypothetical protein D3C85_1619500 [compost metagenome]